MDGYRKILLRSVNRIGDVVFTLPAIRAIKDSSPGATVTVLAKPIASELFVNCPFVDDVIVFYDKGRHKGLGGRLRLAKELRGMGFDLAVMFHNGLESALVSFVAGIPERVGYRKEMRGAFLTRSLRFPKAPVHRLDYNNRLAGLVGAAVDGPEGRGGRGGGGGLLFLTDDERGRAGELLKDSGTHRPLVCIVPGAMAASRRWFPERFAEVADSLIEKTGGSVVLLGGPEGTGDAEKIISLMKHTPLNLTGKTRVRQLMAVLDACDLVLANDTGPMQLAAALGRPVVTFFGAGDPDETGPPGPNVRIIRKDVDCGPCVRDVCPEGHLKCLDLISAQEVMEAVAEMLEG